MQSKPLTDGLADLARANQSTRDAALLRATTELFVRDLAHDRDQITRYEELTTHLLPKVGIGDRAYVADRLAACADAPRSVIAMLTRDVIDVAAAVIRRSPVLEPLDLLAVIAATGVEHHRLLARRPALADQVKRALRLTGDAEVIGTLDDGAAIRGSDSSPTAAPQAPATPAIGATRPATTAHPSGRHAAGAFLALGRAERLRTIADHATRPPLHSPLRSTNRLDRAFRSILGAAKIVGYAKRGETEALIAAIAEGLDIDRGFISAAIGDTTGEPLAVMLKALHLDDTQAQQVFLLATPAGRDTATFFPLADLYAGMEPFVAETLVELWRRGDQRGRHQPYVADDGDRRRPAASETPLRDTIANRDHAKRA